MGLAICEIACARERFMADVQVSVGENAEYLQFVAAQIRKYPSSMPQSVLWHYTSGEGLLGIINSGEFWLTQLSCVNDTTELRYSQSLLREAKLSCVIY